MRWSSVWLLLAAIGMSANAANGVWEEYDQIINKASTIAAHGPTLFGDQVSMQSGALSFRVTDVSLRGNSALPVEITRTFQTETSHGLQRRGPPRDSKIFDESFSDWELELPSIGGVFPLSTGWINPGFGQGHKRCEVASPSQIGSPNVSVSGISFPQAEIWSGTRISIPGRGSQALLLRTTSLPQPAAGGAYWITSDWTSVSCLTTVNTSNGGAGQGFVATTADGVRYTFDWMARNHETRLAKVYQTHTLGSSYVFVERGRYALYATRVEDRFGNWVAYTYTNNANDPIKLTRIESNDGRVITLSHAGNFITGVMANGRPWTYGYTGERLTSVTLPDTSHWAINLDGFKRLELDYEDSEPQVPYRGCADPGSLWPRTYTGTITHPSGAVGSFVLDQRRIVRSGMPAGNCDFGNANDQNDDNDIYPAAWDAYALLHKTVSGPGLSPATWTYGYASSNRDATVVLGPGAFERHTFGNTFRVDEGKLLGLEIGNSITDLLRNTTYSYSFATSGTPYPARLGDNGQWRSDAFTEEYVRPALSTAIVQQGVTFTWQVNTGCGGYVYCLDGFARPTNVTKVSTLGYSKTEATLYADNVTYWVLGQVATVTCVAPASCAGIVQSQTDYWSNGLPMRTYDFGKPRQYFEYELNASIASGQLGTLKTVTDGNNNTIGLSAWKRGIPQEISHPATLDQPSGTGESAVVDDNGWIESVTNEVGAKTCYDHDPMGRVKLVVYPAEAVQGTPAPLGVCNDNKWLPTTITFTGGHAPLYGLPAGHWRQVIQTGNTRTVTLFDAMWRPVVQERYDATDGSSMAATLSQTVTRYDAGGRKSFVSYPQRTLVPAVIDTWANPAVTPNALGTWTEYDALDRIKLVKQNSEQSWLTTSTVYLAPFKTETTNPRTKTTRMSYVAYDQPTYDMPNGILEYEGRATEIYRDVFGKPLQIRRRLNVGDPEASRYYVYDGYQQLCKTIEPETGATLHGYDPAGNLKWTSAGLPASTACEPDGTSQTVAARKVSRDYDQRNRLKTLSFPDGLGNQVWTYTADSLPATITTYNGSGQTTPVVNAYSYNKRRMPTGEGETITQPGWYSWGIGYGYDSHGNLASQVYPTNLTVSYAPNALGQATQVTAPGETYASNVSYYPNGAIYRFTYGNSIVHEMFQNDRQLPESTTTSTGVVQFAYAYDENGNPTAITDQASGQNGLNSKTMTYDGLDRLLTAYSPAYGGTDGVHRFTYDNLDNLKSWTQTGGKDYAAYDYDSASNRLTNIRNSAGSAIVNLGYDVQGNLANKGGRSYTFDYGNRLRGAGASVGVETYLYDGHGRRVLNWRSADNTTTVSQYAQTGNLMYQENTKTALLSEYLYLAGSLLATRETAWVAGGGGPTTVKYQHTDALGSPVAVTGQNGGVLERFEYEPYGGMINKPNYDGIGYTGHVMDGATGLTYMQQRYYDPSIGRFLSMDPVTANPTNGTNFNRYWYGNNNPYRFTDPDGRKACPTGTRICFDSPRTERAGPRQAGRSDAQRRVDSQVRSAARLGRLSDGTRLTNDKEHGFKASEEGTSSNPMEQICQRCADGSVRDGGRFNVKALESDESGGHTHKQQQIPGPEDGGLARVTDKDAYVITPDRVWSVESTGVGFRAWLIDGPYPNRGEIGDIQKTIDKWNVNQGGSGVSCATTSGGC